MQVAPIQMPKPLEPGQKIDPVAEQKIRMQIAKDVEEKMKKEAAYEIKKVELSSQATLKVKNLKINDLEVKVIELEKELQRMRLNPGGSSISLAALLPDDLTEGTNKDG